MVTNFTMVLLLVRACAGLVFEDLQYKNCSLQVEDPSLEERTQGECPPWFYNMSGKCLPGPDLNGIIQHDVVNLQTSLQMCFCITIEEYGVLTVGSCVYTCASIGLTYYPLPCHVSQLANFTCNDFQRHGTLCKDCKEGYAIPVYSYEISCVECNNYHYNWLKYLTVAFLPLILFYIVVSVFSISFTSPMLSGMVIASQIFAHPTVLQEYLVFLKLGVLPKPFNPNFIKVFLTFASLWNLDYFRLFYSFCLHPNASAMFIMSLDFTTTLFPVLLIILTYLLVKLNDINCKIVVLLWRICSFVLRPVKQQWKMQKSLIDVFASFIYLSSTRLLVTSLSFLIPTTAYSYDANSNGQPTLSQQNYLFYSPSIEYFRGAHLPYALLSVTFSLLFFLLPMMLLFFYPFPWFQRTLNYLKINSIALRTFVDAFQGYYKDGSNGTKDYRYFSGLLLLNPLIFNLSFMLTQSSMYYISGFGWCFIYVTLHFMFQPYKSKVHNYASMLLTVTTLVSVWGIYINSSRAALEINELFHYNTYTSTVDGGALILSLALIVLPLVGLWIYAIVLIFIKLNCIRKLKH